VPTRIVIEISPAEQAHLTAELRRARRGHWLALQIVLLLNQSAVESDIHATAEEASSACFCNACVTSAD